MNLRRIVIGLFIFCIIGLFIFCIYSSSVNAAKYNGSDELRSGLRHYGNHEYGLALESWKISAEKGHADSQFILGNIYYFGEGVRQDYKMARTWYEKAAAQGNAFAQVLLGYMYEQGNGVDENLITAKKWYGEACDGGFQDGCDEYRRLNENRGR